MREYVVVLGASPDTSRYAYKAIQALSAAGHVPIPVNPKYKSIGSLLCYPDLNACPKPVDTVTVYLNPENLLPLTKQILDLSPGRVIFNPGSETAAVENKLKQAGITVLQACTLVMLNMKQF